jgi:hypothetical protein
MIVGGRCGLKFLSLIVIAVLSFSIIFSSMSNISGQVASLPVLAFEKPSYLFKVGTEFNVTVVVKNVSQLETWQFGLAFDPNIIEFKNGSIPEDNVFAGNPISVPSPDNSTPGYLVWGADIGPRPFTGPPFDGTGKLCILTFFGKSAGNSSLTFSNLAVDTFLLTTNGVDIVFTAVNGLVHSSFGSDVNQDGVVNMKDINDAVLAFNTFLNSARWNPYADVDGSNRVDLRDIVIIVLDFNKRE